MVTTHHDRSIKLAPAEERVDDYLADLDVGGAPCPVTLLVTTRRLIITPAYQTVRLQEENTRRAQEELRLAQERYQLGAGTFLELLDSQTLATQAEVDQIESVFAFHQALTSLEAAVAKP